MLYSNNKVFFVSEYFFRSNKTDWAKNYLFNKNYRITEMLQPILKSDFLRLYSTTIKNCFSTEMLLLRAKVYNQSQDDICLFQVWSNYECYNRFLIKVGSQKLEKAIKLMHLQCRKKLTDSVPINSLHKQIEKMKSKKIIWQFVNTMFQKDWMIIGDPIREKET